jgi:hypothetical protein
VTLYSEEPGTGLKYAEKVLEGGLHYLEVDIPSIPKGDKAELLLTYQVLLYPLPMPLQTEYFKKPQKPDRDVAPYLRSSPLIDPRHASIKKLASELTKEATNDWNAVEKFYDWVLDNIEMTGGEAVGAVKSLANKKGCREDRINLFLALCRCHKIPARTVWANGMEYAEFFLIDSGDQGHWIPCQLSGAREFGTLASPRIIEQKGEDFELPGSGGKRRFVNVTASVDTVRNARAEPERPDIQFVRRPLHQPPTNK